MFVSSWALNPLKKFPLGGSAWWVVVGGGDWIPILCSALGLSQAQPLKAIMSMLALDLAQLRPSLF